MSIYSLHYNFTTGDFTDNEPLLQRLLKLPATTLVNIDEHYIGRLDLVSYEHYQTTELWWVIAILNGIDNPTDFTNRTLFLPTKRDIEDAILNRSPLNG